MLTPIKSVTMLIGVGHGLPVWSHSQSCDMCSSTPVARADTTGTRRVPDGPEAPLRGSRTQLRLISEARTRCEIR